MAKKMKNVETTEIKSINLQQFDIQVMELDPRSIVLWADNPRPVADGRLINYAVDNMAERGWRNEERQPLCYRDESGKIHALRGNSAISMAAWIVNNPSNLTTSVVESCKQIAVRVIVSALSDEDKISLCLDRGVESNTTLYMLLHDYIAALSTGLYSKYLKEVEFVDAAYLSVNRASNSGRTTRAEIKEAKKGLTQTLRKEVYLCYHSEYLADIIKRYRASGKSGAPEYNNDCVTAAMSVLLECVNQGETSRKVIEDRIDKAYKDKAIKVAEAKAKKEAEKNGEVEIEETGKVKALTLDIGASNLPEQVRNLIGRVLASVKGDIDSSELIKYAAQWSQDNLKQ